MFGLHIGSKFMWPSLDPLSAAFQLAERLNVDQEASLATWYGQTLLLAASLLALYIGRAKQAAKDPHAALWLVLGVLFLGLSVDEGTTLHEHAATPLQQAFGIQPGPWFFAWVIPALVLLIIFAVVYFRFWLALPLGSRLLLAAAALLYAGGAVGMEMVSAAHATSGHFNHYTYNTLAGIEELMETTGVSLAIYGLLRYLAAMPAKHVPGVRFTR